MNGAINERNFIADKELRKINNKLRVLSWEHETRCNKYKELKLEVESLAKKYMYDKLSDHREVYLDLMGIVDKMAEIDENPHDWAR